MFLKKIKWKYILAAFLIAMVSSFMTLTLIGLALGLDAARAAHIARFFAAMRFIEFEYVEEVDDEKMINGAISGMVKSLGDPYSVYLDEDTYRKAREHAEGTFGGIGVVMGYEEKTVRVLSVMEGTPGERAGVLAGDRIVAVDGRPTDEMDYAEVAIAIRGRPGTTVALSIERDGEERRDYVIERDHIHVRTAAGKMIEDGVGYIRISSFSENTAKEFSESYEKLEGDGLKGLVIDLRANPGGLMTTCVDIAKKLVPKGPIVSVVQRDGTREEYSSTLEKAPCPMVVLIDKGSASASEILAGALKDTGAAELVGLTSYGKGSVQVMMPIPDGGDAVKLTIARYYTPSGTSINGIGIAPDIEVENDSSSSEDAQLKRAVEVIRSKI